MLLAFDYYHDQNGNADTRKSTFHTPNAYASKLAQLFPDRFEWIASIHPYRKDAVSALSERDWHPRLLNGSDYPLPGVVPLFSLSGFVKKGYLIESEAKVLTKIREHNALLFDFMLKRRLNIDGVSLPASVFETRGRFENVSS